MVADGMVTVDDRIDGYFPELPEYARQIKVRHLIHHTSGLRDYLDLWVLAGRSYEEAFDNHDAMSLICRQRELNYAPGARYLYSNSGYRLLAELIHRVSGRTLRDFAEARIFRPLGMDQTFFDDENEKNDQRVVSYRAVDGQFVPMQKKFNIVGSGGLLSTVDDFVLWDRNLVTPAAGLKSISDQVQTPDSPDNGNPIDYGFGLLVTGYRGLAVVRHGGRMLGFRAEYMHFSETECGIIVFGNTSAVNASLVAFRIADIALRTEFPLMALAGRYQSDELGRAYEVRFDHGDLWLDPQVADTEPLRSIGRHAFAAGEWTLSFRVGENGVSGFDASNDRIAGVRFNRIQDRCARILEGGWKMVRDLAVLHSGARSGRYSSWDKTGRNADRWLIAPGQTAILADITGPGAITHIWMTQSEHYRDCLLKITWDNAKRASVIVPLGDFFGLGHEIVNSYQSLLFSASTSSNNEFNAGCALNSYVLMPFRERAVVELVNESDESHLQYFYIDFETYDRPSAGLAYFHAEFRRANPFGGWGHEIAVNTAEANVVNKGKTAWENNFVILNTKGRGHYLGCNLSVTNFQGTWWGEGDDMIWIDGYKWPPDLHGTGSEDYLNQAWRMQQNAFLRNGSSIHEQNTNGYQTSYVFHVENPVRFQKEIRVTIEHGHGNHLANEMSSVAYWYAERPAPAFTPPPAAKRKAIVRNNQGDWLFDKRNQVPGRRIAPNPEMQRMKAKWARKKPD